MHNERDSILPPTLRRLAVGTLAPINEAATSLLDRPTDELGEIDLSRTLVVVPGARAGRQLLLTLDALATERKIAMVPPRTVTPSTLLATMSPRLARPVCDADTWTASVADVLGRGGPAVAAVLSNSTGTVERRAMAKTLVAADRRLRAGMVDWDDAASAAESLGGDPDRYRSIGTIMLDARGRLDRLGFFEPEQAAVERLMAFETRPESEEVRDFDELVLFGLVDPTPRFRRVAETAAAVGLDVTVMTIAGPSRTDAFDPWGAVRPSVWLAAPPVVPLESIQVEADPMEEAIGVVDRLGEIAATTNDRLDPDRVGIVLADEANADLLRRECSAVGVSIHLATGRTLASTAVARSLSSLERWWTHGDTDAFGAVLADPIASRLARLGDATAESVWSAWAATSVPIPAVEGCFAGVEPVLETSRKAFQTACDVVVDGPLGVTIDAILELLGSIVQPNDPDLGRAFDALVSVAAPVVRIPESLQPTTTPAEACAVLLDLTRTTSVPGAQDPEALETIGWLEAPFDPTPMVMVVGMHDGAVPGDAEDPLLPNALRTALGLDDEASRRARDLWVLESILGRDPDARFSVPRRSLSGEPLVPSRLLFGDRGEDLARRVGRLFETPVVRPVPAAAVGAFGRCRPPIPPTPPPDPMKAMSVTAFRTYLKSPYRFWVERVLGLKVDEPVGHEFDPRTFGNLLHDAVETFGKAERDRQRRGDAPTTDPGAIEEELVEALRSGAASILPAEPGVGIRLQMRVIEKRLAMIAEKQAAWTLQGWSIHDVEASIEKVLEIPGDVGQRVTGRIDRIDRHDEHGWMVIDFKSSDRGDYPNKTHYLKGQDRWIDLQLPLYRWAALTMLPGEPEIASIASAYFLAPADPGRVGIARADKIDGKYEEAMDTAVEVVRSIRAGWFEDAGLQPPYGGDPISLFMRTHALGDSGEDA